MLDKLKKLKKFKDQASKLQNALSGEEVTVEVGNVKVVMGADQKLKTVTINDQEHKDLIKAMNKATKKAQKIAAKKMQEIGGLSNLGL